MDISIVMPSFNHGQYLKPAIDSILEQSHPAAEIIVNDGGSTDGSVEILQQYGNRISWRSAPDCGQTDAINRGLHQASGEIVSYLNSDDVLMPGALATVSAYFSAHPECEILYGDAHHLNADGSFMELYPAKPWDYDYLFVTCFICQPATFWRRDIHARYGYFDETLDYAMDYEFWLRLGRSVNFDYLPGKILAGSRLHAETKTLRHRIPVHRDCMLAVQRHTSKIEHVHGWLRHLARFQTEADGLPPYPDQALNPAYTRAYVGNLLTIANLYDIEISPLLHEEMDKQLSTIPSLSV